jgi:ribose transport system substrate-binding protein
MAGKTIASIPVNSAIAFTQYYAKAAERIADEVGFTFATWPNQGSPSEWAQGVQKGLSDEADVIELFAGIDPAQIAPSMAEAERAGTPVLATDGYDLTQDVDPGLATGVNCPCSEAARVMADWAAVKMKGEGKVLVLTSSDVKASAASESVMKDEFGKVCPSCDVDYMDIPSSDWATKILPQVQSALVADPEISYVLPVFDTMAIWAVQAIMQAGRQDSVRIATYNGTPSILDMMRESEIIEMNVGQSNDWMAHVTLDQTMRVAAGLPTNPEATWPLYIWTHDNLEEAGEPASDSQGYGDDYKNGFRQLWGMS